MKSSKNIFDYAREKIRKKHQAEQINYLKSRGITVPDFEAALQAANRYAERDEEIEHINDLEKEARTNIKNAISCRTSAFWYVQDEDAKFFLGGCAAYIVFILIVFLYGLKVKAINLNILDACQSFFYAFVTFGVIFLYRLIRKKRISQRKFYIVWLLFLLLSIPYIPVLCGYETHQIGDFYEAKEYSAKYYVLLSREPKSVKNRKVYCLPALIERRYDDEGQSDIQEDFYGQQYGGKDIYSLNYHINRLYFKNGGYLTFDYDDHEFTIIRVNKETVVTDSHYDNYYIRLTTRKAR